MKTKTENTIIPMMEKKTVTFKIKGVTPLIMNQFPEKARRKMLEKQMKKATKGMEAKDPDAMYKGSLYLLGDGKTPGFPAVGFKASMVRAGKQLGMNMTDTRGRFHVLADEGDLVKIEGEHHMREDVVRLESGVVDIRFRAEFSQWKAEIKIIYNVHAISEEQLLKLIEVAGFSCGIGEWRPEKSNSGSYGLFEIDN